MAVGPAREQREAELMDMGYGWMSEIFSDLVACAIAGPAYLCAFVTHFIGQITSSRGTVAYDRDHPPTRLRLKLIYDILTRSDNNWEATLTREFPFVHQIVKEWQSREITSYATGDLTIAAKILLTAD